MEIAQGLLHGFSVALTTENMLACFLGVALGSLVGVLPGIGPNAGMALLIPADLHHAADCGNHHAGGNLLRIDVRRLDEVPSCSTCRERPRR